MTSLLLGALMGCFTLTLVAAPLQNLRCDSRLVSVGASTTQLEAFCGKPASVEQQYIRVPVERYDQNTGQPITVYEDQPYEVWVYNFGPSRFVTRVTIMGNAIRQMDTDGYGW